MSESHSNPLRRRALAAKRLQPIRCGYGVGRRDPWLDAEPMPRPVLDCARAEARRLYRLGWSLAEIEEVTGVKPRKLRAA